ncbi:unnamed protein product [Leuciscus chuanchicus]
MVFAPTDSPAAVEEIRQSGSRPVRVSRKRSLSRIFLEEQGRADPRVASPSSLRFSPRLPPDSGGRTGQGRRMLSAACSPTLDEPTLVPNCDAVSEHRPVASASEEGSPLSSQRLDLASSPRAVVPACVGHQRVPADLPQGVLNTITQARAPSTRHLYASKWSVFSSWCTARGVSPLHCGVTEVLSFLQELLDKGRSPSTLKVYVAAIAVFSSTTLGQSIGRNDLVIRFLRGAKRLNPPRPPTVPIWDLSTVLEAMKGHPFEPLQEIDLKHLSFKTAFLLALASVKRIGDLHALSVSATCMEFGPNDSRVILKPKHGYVPKSLNTPFRAQVISLSALPVTEGNMDESSLCPVRALRAYVSRSSVFRQTEQLFVSFSGRSKGLAASKQTLSRWVVDAIALAYTTKGMQCPLGVKAHSTRSMASSWAWSSVFGDSVSVMEGDSVTLNTDLTEIPEDEDILWKFGAEKSLIAQISKAAGIFSTYDGPDGRFRDRLKLDNQTGSLTITNTRTEHAGVYQLLQSGAKRSSKTFSVSVYAHLPTPNITRDCSSSSSSSNCSLVCSSVLNVSDVTLSWYAGISVLSSISVCDLSISLSLPLEVEYQDKNTYSCVLNNPISNQTTHLDINTICHTCADEAQPLFYIVLISAAAGSLMIVAAVGIFWICKKCRKIYSGGKFETPEDEITYADPVFFKRNAQKTYKAICDY